MKIDKIIAILAIFIIGISKVITTFKPPLKSINITSLNISCTFYFYYNLYYTIFNRGDVDFYEENKIR